MAIGTIEIKIDTDEIEQIIKDHVERIKNDLDLARVIRCRDCKWFGTIGCAINVVDDNDRLKEDDFCSFADPKTDEYEPLYNDDREESGLIAED